MPNQTKDDVARIIDKLVRNSGANPKDLEYVELRSEYLRSAAGTSAEKQAGITGFLNSIKSICDLTKKIVTSQEIADVFPKSDPKVSGVDLTPWMSTDLAGWTIVNEEGVGSELKGTIHDVTTKLNEAAIYLDTEGEIHQKHTEAEPRSNIFEKIMKGTGWNNRGLTADLNLATVVDRAWQDTSENRQKVIADCCQRVTEATAKISAEDLKAVIDSAVIESVSWMKEDLEDFGGVLYNRLYITLVEKMKEKNPTMVMDKLFFEQVDHNLRALSEQIASEFTDAIERRWPELAVLDRNVLGINNDEDYAARGKELTGATVTLEQANLSRKARTSGIVIPSGGEPDGGVVILTSDGGSCHRMLAEQAQKSLAQGTSPIPSVVMNTSRIHNTDALSTVSPLKFTETYPVCNEQMRNQALRSAMGNLHFTLEKFLPPVRQPEVRCAIDHAKKGMGGIKVLYATEEYGHDVHYTPKGTDIVVQLCDMRRLNESSAKRVYLDRGMASSSQVHALVSDQGLKLPPQFPDGTLIPEVLVEMFEESKKDSEKGEMLASIGLARLPNANLSAQDLKDKFNDACELLQLNKKADRIVLTFGGEGDIQRLSSYLNQFAEELKQYPRTEPPPLEILLCCGNNENGFKRLTSELKEINAALEGQHVTIKPAGFIPQDKFIGLLSNENTMTITKPGAGTITEAMRYDYDLVIAYDPNRTWEGGNVEAAMEAQVGIKIVPDSKDDAEKLSAGQLIERVATTHKRHKPKETDEQLLALAKGRIAERTGDVIVRGIIEKREEQKQTQLK